MRVQRYIRYYKLDDEVRIHEGLFIYKKRDRRGHIYYNQVFTYPDKEGGTVEEESRMRNAAARIAVLRGDFVDVNDLPGDLKKRLTVIYGESFWNPPRK